MFAVAVLLVVAVRSAPQNLMKVELFIAPAATFARTVCTVCPVCSRVLGHCGKQKKVRTACPKNLIRRGKSSRALGITTELQPQSQPQPPSAQAAGCVATWRLCLGKLIIKSISRAMS